MICILAPEVGFHLLGEAITKIPTQPLEVEPVHS